jgi:hypothetical protein
MFTKIVSELDKNYHCYNAPHHKRLSLNEYTKNQQLCQTQNEVIHNQGITNRQALPIDFLKSVFKSTDVSVHAYVYRFFEEN